VGVLANIRISFVYSFYYGKTPTTPSVNLRYPWLNSR